MVSKDFTNSDQDTFWCFRGVDQYGGVSSRTLISRRKLTDRALKSRRHLFRFQGEDHGC
jgi:hypothetical protein